LSAEELPKHWNSRLETWNALKQQQAQNTSSGVEMAHANCDHDSHVHLSVLGSPESQIMTYAAGVSTPLDLLPPKDEARKTAIVALLDGEVWDLTRPIPPNVKTVEILDFNHPLGADTFWHSSAHILGQALEFFYREHQVNLSDGPALTDGGFFYDLHIRVC